jgi:5-methylcytosine-specific restriction endonuclease McrA
MGRPMSAFSRSRPRSGTEWQRERDAVRARAAAGEECGICGQPIDTALKYPDPQSCSLDHIVEVCRGGHEHDPANQQPSHLSCNRRKSGRFGQLSLGPYSDTTYTPPPTLVSGPPPEW